jgi:glycosyltransferase involved in cell wall biosynthesis
MYLYRRPLFAFPYLVWTSAAMLRSDTILTVSESSAHDIWHTFRRRATIIPPVFADLPSSSDAELVPDNIRTKTYIVYNGGFDPRKNVPNLLAGFAIAAQQWGDLSLVIVGKGYAALDSEIESLGISEKVVRTGYVEEETRWAITKAAAAVAYPSLYEGFGLPLLEAFAVGTPVLTAHFPKLPGMLRSTSTRASLLRSPTESSGCETLRSLQTCAPKEGDGSSASTRSSRVSAWSSNS